MSKQIVDSVDFAKTWELSTNVKEVAEKLNMKLGSVQAKASKMRKDGIPLKSMQRGGGRKKTDKSAILAVLAEIRNVTVEELMRDKTVKAAVTATEKVEAAAN